MTDYIRVEAESVISPKSVQLTITDLTGKTIYSKKKYENIDSGFEIDLTKFPKGMYLLIIKIGDNFYKMKIIKLVFRF